MNCCILFPKTLLLQGMRLLRGTPRGRAWLTVLAFGFLPCLSGSFGLVDELYAWGPTGHRITGRIAENHLSSQARKRTGAILKGAGLARVSTWADEIRSYDAWRCAGAFHYTSVPDGGNYLETRFARRGDIVRALIFFEDLLRDPGTSPRQRSWALKFLVHLMGDLHQPLHVGRREDRGGNRIRVRWFRKRMDLHHVWDSAIIDFQKLSYTEFARFLDRGKPSPSLVNGTYLDWANESMAYRARIYRCYIRDGCRCAREGGCPGGYDFLQGGRGSERLGYRYHRHGLKITEARLLAGGVRLANILNDIFEGRSLSPGARRVRRWVRAKDPSWSKPMRACLRRAGQTYTGF